jgi:acyl carrier protein
MVKTPAPTTASLPPKASHGSQGLGDTLLAIVADKTGYPSDLLHLEMKLESDLGVDSIKRVEILSALREAIPSLPEVNPGDLAKLSTLGQIVEHLSGHEPSQPRKGSPRESSHPSKEPPPMR